MASVSDYLTLLNNKAQDTNEIERFYIGMFDDELYELELVLDEEEKNRELNEAIMTEYRKWLDEMTADDRKRLEEFNRSQNGANKNWLVEELLADYEV